MLTVVGSNAAVRRAGRVRRQQESEQQAVVEIWSRARSRGAKTRQQAKQSFLILSATVPAAPRGLPSFCLPRHHVLRHTRIRASSLRHEQPRLHAVFAIAAACAAPRTRHATRDRCRHAPPRIRANRVMPFAVYARAVTRTETTVTGALLRRTTAMGREGRVANAESRRRRR